MTAEILERTFTDGVTRLKAKIVDEDIGELGIVEVTDGPLAKVKADLRIEADRLASLPVGTVIQL